MFVAKDKTGKIITTGISKGQVRRKLIQMGYDPMSFEPIEHIKDTNDA